MSQPILNNGESSPTPQYAAVAASQRSQSTAALMPPTRRTLLFPSSTSSASLTKSQAMPTPTPMPTPAPTLPANLHPTPTATNTPHPTTTQYTISNNHRATYHDPMMPPPPLSVTPSLGSASPSPLPSLAHLSGGGGVSLNINSQTSQATTQQHGASRATSSSQPAGAHAAVGAVPVGGGLSARPTQAKRTLLSLDKTSANNTTNCSTINAVGTTVHSQQTHTVTTTTPPTATTTAKSPANLVDEKGNNSNISMRGNTGTPQRGLFASTSTSTYLHVATAARDQETMPFIEEDEELIIAGGGSRDLFVVSNTPSIHVGNGVGVGNLNASPINYGRRSMSFHSTVSDDCCNNNNNNSYGTVVRCDERTAGISPHRRAFATCASSLLFEEDADLCPTEKLTATATERATVTNQSLHLTHTPPRATRTDRQVSSITFSPTKIPMVANNRDQFIDSSSFSPARSPPLRIVSQSSSHGGREGVGVGGDAAHVHSKAASSSSSAPIAIASQRSAADEEDHNGAHFHQQRAPTTTSQREDNEAKCEISDQSRISTESPRLTAIDGRTTDVTGYSTAGTHRHRRQEDNEMVDDDGTLFFSGREDTLARQSALSVVEDSSHNTGFAAADIAGDGLVISVGYGGPRPTVMDLQAQSHHPLDAGLSFPYPPLPQPQPPSTSDSWATDTFSPRPTAPTPTKKEAKRTLLNFGSARPVAVGDVKAENIEGQQQVQRPSPTPPPAPIPSHNGPVVTAPLFSITTATSTTDNKSVFQPKFKPKPTPSAPLSTNPNVKAIPTPTMSGTPYEWSSQHQNSGNNNKLAKPMVQHSQQREGLVPPRKEQEKQRGPRNFFSNEPPEVSAEVTAKMSQFMEAVLVTSQQQLSQQNTVGTTLKKEEQVEEKATTTSASKYRNTVLRNNSAHHHPQQEGHPSAPPHWFDLYLSCVSGSGTTNKAPHDEEEGRGKNNPYIAAQNEENDNAHSLAVISQTNGGSPPSSLKKENIPPPNNYTYDFADLPNFNPLNPFNIPFPYQPYVLQRNAMSVLRAALEANNRYQVGGTTAALARSYADERRRRRERARTERRRLEKAERQRLKNEMKRIAKMRERQGLPPPSNESVEEAAMASKARYLSSLHSTGGITFNNNNSLASTTSPYASRQNNNYHSSSTFGGRRNDEVCSDASPVSSLPTTATDNDDGDNANKNNGNGRRKKLRRKRGDKGKVKKGTQIDDKSKSSTTKQQNTSSVHGLNRSEEASIDQISTASSSDSDLSKRHVRATALRDPSFSSSLLPSSSSESGISESSPSDNLSDIEEGDIRNAVELHKTNSLCGVSVLEAPTGTGKTHMLLNSVLSWLSLQRFKGAVARRQLLMAERRAILKEFYPQGMSVLGHKNHEESRENTNGLLIPTPPEEDDADEVGNMNWRLRPEKRKISAAAQKRRQEAEMALRGGSSSSVTAGGTATAARRRNIFSSSNETGGASFVKSSKSLLPHGKEEEDDSVAPREAIVQTSSTISTAEAKRRAAAALGSTYLSDSSSSSSSSRKRGANPRLKNTTRSNASKSIFATRDDDTDGNNSDDGDLDELPLTAQEQYEILFSMSEEECLMKLGCSEIATHIPLVKPKVWFSSRTHSQLQQCAEEMLLTEFSKAAKALATIGEGGIDLTDLNSNSINASSPSSPPTQRSGKPPPKFSSCFNPYYIPPETRDKFIDFLRSPSDPLFRPLSDLDLPRNADVAAAAASVGVSSKGNVKLETADGNDNVDDVDEEVNQKNRSYASYRQTEALKLVFNDNSAVDLSAAVSAELFAKDDKKRAVHCSDKSKKGGTQYHHRDVRSDVRNDDKGWEEDKIGGEVNRRVGLLDNGKEEKKKNLMVTADTSSLSKRLVDNINDEAFEPLPCSEPSSSQGDAAEGGEEGGLSCVVTPPPLVPPYPAHHLPVPNAPVAAYTPIMPLSFVHVAAREQLCINEELRAQARNSGGGGSAAVNDLCREAMENEREVYREAQSRLISGKHNCHFKNTSSTRATIIKKDVQNGGHPCTTFLANEGRFSVGAGICGGGIVDIEDIITEVKVEKGLTSNCHSCPYARFDRLKTLRHEVRRRGSTDLTEFKALGVKFGACPFLASRQLLRSADVVFIHFNYLVDPQMATNITRLEPIEDGSAAEANGFRRKENERDERRQEEADKEKYENDNANDNGFFDKKEVQKSNMPPNSNNSVVKSNDGVDKETSALVAKLRSTESSSRHQNEQKLTKSQQGLLNMLKASRRGGRKDPISLRLETVFSQFVARSCLAPTTMEGDVVIFDEGHNVVDVARNVLRADISYSQLRRAKNAFALYYEKFGRFMKPKTQATYRMLIDVAEKLQSYLRRSQRAFVANNIASLGHIGGPNSSAAAGGSYRGYNNNNSTTNRYAPNGGNNSNNDPSHQFSDRTRRELNRPLQRPDGQFAKVSYKRNSGGGWGGGGGSRLESYHAMNNKQVVREEGFSGFTFSADIDNINFMDRLREHILNGDVLRRIKGFTKGSVRQIAKLSMEYPHIVTLDGFGSPFFCDTRRYALFSFPGAKALAASGGAWVGFGVYGNDNIGGESMGAANNDSSSITGGGRGGGGGLLPSQILSAAKRGRNVSNNNNSRTAPLGVTGARRERRGPVKLPQWKFWQKYAKEKALSAAGLNPHYTTDDLFSMNTAGSSASHNGTRPLLTNNGQSSLSAFTPPKSKLSSSTGTSPPSRAMELAKDALDMDDGRDDLDTQLEGRGATSKNSNNNNSEIGYRKRGRGEEEDLSSFDTDGFAPAQQDAFTRGARHISGGHYGVGENGGLPVSSRRFGGGGGIDDDGTEDGTNDAEAQGRRSKGIECMAEFRSRQQYVEAVYEECGFSDVEESYANENDPLLDRPAFPIPSHHQNTLPPSSTAATSNQRPQNPFADVLNHEANVGAGNNGNTNTPHNSKNPSSSSSSAVPPTFVRNREAYPELFLLPDIIAGCSPSLLSAPSYSSSSSGGYGSGLASASPAAIVAADAYKSALAMHIAKEERARRIRMLCYKYDRDGTGMADPRVNPSNSAWGMSVTELERWIGRETMATTSAIDAFLDLLKKLELAVGSTVILATRDDETVGRPGRATGGKGQQDNSAANGGGGGSFNPQAIATVDSAKTKILPPTTLSMCIFPIDASAVMKPLQQRCRHIVVAGGTLQPLEITVQPIFPLGAFQFYPFGHIVKSETALRVCTLGITPEPQRILQSAQSSAALPVGGAHSHTNAPMARPCAEFRFVYSQRAMMMQMMAQGCELVLQLSAIVPEGLVLFFTSYDRMHLFWTVMSTFYVPDDFVFTRSVMIEGAGVGVGGAGNSSQRPQWQQFAGHNSSSNGSGHPRRAFPPRTTFIDAIGRFKKLFRETKDRPVDAILTEYTQYIENNIDTTSSSSPAVPSSAVTASLNYPTGVGSIGGGTVKGGRRIENDLQGSGVGGWNPDEEEDEENRLLSRQEVRRAVVEEDRALFGAKASKAHHLKSTTTANGLDPSPSSPSSPIPNTSYRHPPTPCPMRLGAKKPHHRGAIITCVMGGRLSEGINFNDHRGRGVVVFGLPMANPQDAESELTLMAIASGAARGNSGGGGVKGDTVVSFRDHGAPSVVVAPSSSSSSPFALASAGGGASPSGRGGASTDAAGGLVGSSAHAMGKRQAKLAAAKEQQHTKPVSSTLATSTAGGEASGVETAVIVNPHEVVSVENTKASIETMKRLQRGMQNSRGDKKASKKEQDLPEGVGGGVGGDSNKMGGFVTAAQHMKSAQLTTFLGANSFAIATSSKTAIDPLTGAPLPPSAAMTNNSNSKSAKAAPTTLIAIKKDLSLSNTMKSVNQAIGRCIRHLNDHAVIVLCDVRYGEDSVTRKIPQWMRAAVCNYAGEGRGFDDVAMACEDFFDEKEKQARLELEAKAAEDEAAANALAADAEEPSTNMNMMKEGRGVTVNDDNLRGEDEYNDGEEDYWES